MKATSLFAAVFLAFSASLAEALPPVWLWTEQDNGGPVSFTYSCELAAVPEACTLTVTSDFAFVAIRVNGETTGELEPFDPVRNFPIEPFLKPGSNVITLVAEGSPGPSAVAAVLHFRDADGKEWFVESNAMDWRGKSLVEKGRLLPERWAPNTLPDIAPSAEYNQWKEALADPSAQNLSPLPPGFTLSLVRPAAESEDSWVSMVRDEQGRLIIAKEKSGLLRFTLSPEGNEVVEVETINEDLEECRGLVFRKGVLYANANDSKALYRLRDTNGDDQFDEVIEIQATTGSVGHGRNDLALGPEGAIHIIHGDSVDTPDRTRFLTPPEDPGSKPLGHWLTLGENDTKWNLLARGLRNPYGIDFNSHGEAFTYDADNEGDVGLPFYRPSRINHLVEGANYGWHQRPGNTRSIPVYAPDSVPTTFDVGRGSPTGVKFVPAGSWGPAWKDTLLALDWAYGRIIAVKPVPRGASYYASGSVFLEGRPLNVTDLEFGRDGTLWFITGGRKTKSALYRIQYETEAGAEIAGELPRQASERDAFSSRQRELRKRLTRTAEPLSETSECWKLIGSADPWLRNAARVRLERRPPSEWSAFLAAPGNSLGKLTSALALARQGNPSERTRALDLARDLSDSGWGRTEKLTFLRLAEIILSQEAADDALGQELATKVGVWITSPDHPVTRESIRLLALLDRPETIEAAQDLLAQAKTQPDQLFYLEMLSRVRSGWNETSRTKFFKAIAATRNVARGDRFLPPFFEAIENEALSSLEESERETWTRLLQPEPPSESAPTDPRPFVRNWTLDDFQESDFAAATAPRPGAGLALYEAGLCHRCHLFGKQGNPIGPDLTQAGSRYTAMDLLESILHPSSIVAEVYRNLSVEKKSGEIVTGRLVRDDFRQSLLYLSPNPFAPRDLIKIPKEEIVSLTESEISPMPPGLLSSLKREEVIHLIRWLRTPPESP